MLEGYTTLGYVAGQTQRIKLGTLVTGITYRHPGILIKTVTTLDVLSGGRAYLGIGAAWNEEEHAGLGVPFPPLKQRFEMLEETLQAAHLMWGEATPPYQGRHLQMAETLNSPQPLTRPHPPILIGGTGEEKTFRFIARYGDACNIMLFGPGGVDRLRQKLAVLQDRCAEIGRPWSEIEKTTLDFMLVTKDGQKPAWAAQIPIPASSPAQVIERCHQLAELGVDHAILGLIGDAVPGTFDLWGSEIVPAVEKIVPAGR
jgi:F420-dependent oxidoreductase-like protein